MLRIYGKLKTGDRFKAFDYHGGQFVSKLIYATVIDEKHVKSAKEMIEQLNKNNPDFIFYLRGVDEDE